MTNTTKDFFRQPQQRRIISVKVVEQSRVDAYAARVLVPAAVGLKGRAVSKRSAAANGAKVVGDQFRIPMVSCTIICCAGVEL